MKLRQMCGGGTWCRDDLTRLRRPRPGVVVWDYAGWGIFPDAADAGPLTVRFHGRIRSAIANRLPQVYRAGWPDRQNPRHPVRRFGQGWVRVGPYVLGRVDLWDESGAP